MLKGIRFYLLIIIAVFINSIKPDAPTYYGELSKRLLKADQLVKEQSQHADIRKNIKTGNLQEESLQATSQEVQLDFTVKPSSKEECLAFIMAVIPQTTTQEPPHCTTWEKLDRLNILSGTQNDPNNSVINHLGITTVSGLIAGGKMLSTDNLSVSDVQARQVIERYLLDHPDVLEQLTEAFNDIKDGEGYYALYFQEVNKQLQQMLNVYYFGLLNTVTKKLGFDLNKNALALNVSTGAAKFAGLLFLIPWLQLQVAGNIFENGWEKTKNATTSMEKIKEFLKMPFSATRKLLNFEALRHNPRLNMIKKTVLETTKTGTLSRLQAISGNNESLGDRMELAASTYRGAETYFKAAGLENRLTEAAPLIWTVYTDFIYAMQVSGFYSFEKMFHEIITHFHLKLIGVAKITRALETINKIAQEANLPELTSLVEPIRELIETSHPEVKQLLKNLKSETFSSTSFFSNWGRILATNTSMNEFKSLFTDPLRAAGALDVLCSAAKCVKNTEGQEARYNFVTFTFDQTSPALTVKNSWNILVNKPICNDIAFGGNNPRFINLTGPNMGGKSTILKGALQAVELAKLGITNGNSTINLPKLETPVRILVHVDETEDVSAGKSTFMAENEKLRTIVETIESNPDTFFIILEDEPLRGTVRETAAEKLMTHIKKLFTLTNVCGCINTHLEEICSLEKEYPHLINNYFVIIDRTTFARLYKMSKGIPSWWFGPQNAEFRKAYIKHLEDEASKSKAAVREA